jgi:putative membrane protein
MLIRIVINAAALIVAARVVPNIHMTLGPVGVDWLKIGAVALAFALINSYLKPIVKLLALPISLVTMGLVGLFINAAAMLLLSYISGTLGLPFKVASFPPTMSIDALVAAFLAALVVSLVGTGLTLVVGKR